MPRTKIDGLESVGLLPLGDDRETIATPDFISGRFFSAFDLCLKIGTISAIKIAAQCPFGDFSCDPLPGQP